MENRSHALLAGLFTLLLGAALAVAVWWFSGARDPMRPYELHTRGNVTGLNVQANVRYRGMQAGKVEAIYVDPADPRNIVVRIRLRADLPVTHATRASLGYQGVTGLAFVLLEDDGSDPRPLEGQEGGVPRLALAPGLMDQITSAAAGAMRRLADIVDDLAKVFTPDNIARLERTLARLESAVGGVDRTFAKAPDTLDAVKAAFNPTNLARLQATLAHLEKTSAEAPATAVELRALMGELRVLAQRVDSTLSATGQGVTEGTLPQLNELLAEVAHTSRRVGRLVDEVESAPQMLLLGRGGTAPGPGEQGFDPRAGVAR